jgi:iron complex transport system ATP-binding protein
MVSAALLEARNVGVAHGAHTILEGISLTLAAGQSIALIGPNGAGKSTLLKALAGIIAHEGELLLGGRPARSLSRRERAMLLGYVPQHSDLDAALSAREVVGQGRYAHRDPWGRPGKDDEAAIATALEVTGAMALAERPFNRLSYGERRLILLARALATGARILLLDEPTAALDVAHALSLLHRVQDLTASGHAVIVALHHLDEALACCSQALLLRQGRVFRAGAIGDVISAGPIREVFGVELVPGAHFGYRLTGAPKP